MYVNKFAWMQDYASAFGQVDGGSSRVCWASDSGKGVNECECAQCHEARTLFPLFSQLLAANAQIEQWQNIAKLHSDTVQKAYEWLENEVSKGEMSGEEYAEAYKELAEIVGFEMVEEVQVVVTWSQTITIKKPLGEDVSEQDFWTYSNGDPESNFEILEASGLEVEDASE